MTLVRRILLGVVLAAAAARRCHRRRPLGPRAASGRSAAYAITLADLDFPSPPGVSHGDFLAELRFLTRDDERYSTIDPELRNRLAGLFGQHPWVAAVDAVTVTAPKKVRVDLRFRKPALAVQAKNEWRVVDDTGVLLPASAPSEGLRKFVGTPRPHGPAGHPWGDPEVERQAKGSR